MTGSETPTGDAVPDASPWGVTKGNPTDDELAAAVTVLVAAASNTGVVENDELGDRPRAGGWKSYHRVLRRQLIPGRDGWKAAFWR